ncbi:MAG: AmmeMemoRadiSam system radical SAM enzyme [Candidatus Woesearchaeota archaeon]|nr:AmmeMemoRadiSam system radical SAM enzyme [Candidatus Woesearchaeota archaeon]
MKQALYYKKLKENIIQCQLCPRFCAINPGEIGDCRVRKNIDGKLFSLVYAEPCAVSVDQIEKKPLYHFLPGSTSFSIGTTGCNLHCLHCQNWTTSQANAGEAPTTILEPEDAVRQAINSGSKSISYTYNEPSIFYEYVLDTAKLARKKGLKNIMVTNGYINPEPLKELYKYIDAANVDIKGFTEEFYKKIADAKLKPVLEALKSMQKAGTWIEITNLIIPTLNDDLKKIEEMCIWIKENLGTNVPLHFTAFYPTYKLTGKPSTSVEILKKAHDVAKKVGLNYVYVGNVANEYNNTYCPKCKKLLIERTGFFSVLSNNLVKGKCADCKEKIPGVWE